MKVRLVFFSCLDQIQSSEHLQNKIPEPARAHYVYQLSKLQLDGLVNNDPKIMTGKLEKEMDICKRLLKRAERESIKAKENDKKKSNAANEKVQKEKPSLTKLSDVIDDIAEDPLLFHDDHTQSMKTSVSNENSRKQKRTSLASRKPSGVPSENIIEDVEIEGSTERRLQESNHEITEGQNLKDKSSSVLKERVSSSNALESKVSNSSAFKHKLSTSSALEGKVSTSDGLAAKRSVSSMLKGKADTSKALESKVSTSGTFNGKVSTFSARESTASTSSGLEGKVSEEKTLRELSSHDFIKGKELFLSENQLCVAGLYFPVNRNCLSTETRLSCANNERLEIRRQAERNAYRSLQNRLPFDLKARFKFLINKSKAARQKEITSKWMKPKHKSIHSYVLPQKDDEWAKYYKEQEQMEMRVATHSELQDKVLSRLKEEMQRKKEEPDIHPITGAGLKHGKANRSKNARDSLSLSQKSVFFSTDNNNPPPNLSHGDRNKRNQNQILRKLSASDYRNDTAIDEVTALSQKLRMSQTGYPKYNVASSPKKGKDKTQMMDNNQQNNQSNNKKSVQFATGPSIITSNRGIHTLGENSSSLVGQKSKGLTRISPGDLKHQGLKLYEPCGWNVTKYRRNSSTVLLQHPRIRRLGGGIISNNTSLNKSQNQIESNNITSDNVSNDDIASQSLCQCLECLCDAEMLAHLRPAIRECSFTYPLKLGHIQRQMEIPKVIQPQTQQHSQFADDKILEPEIESESSKNPWKHYDMNIVDKIQEKILNLMNEMIICKEILSTNQESTYTTITFSRGMFLMPGVLV